ncbi:MAG: hypothetical protein ACXVEF_08920 [Polyangiales bacterium]
MRRFAFLALLLASCSSSTESGVTPGTDGGGDTKITSDGSGCVNPKEGDPCAMGDTLCPGNEGGCCAGYVWQCMDGSWKKLGLGCACLPEDAGSDTSSDASKTDAGPFACGSSTCTADQICKTQESGIDGGTSSKSCEALPADCAATPTCACVKAKIGASCTVHDCTDDGKGHVTLSCMGA